MTSASARFFPQGFGILLMLNLVNYADRSVLSAVLPMVREAYFSGREDAGLKLGLLQTAFLVSYMVTAPVFGRLARGYSPWRLMGVGAVVWSLCTVWTGLASDYAMLVMARVGVGVGEAAFGPLAPALIAGGVDAERRGRVMSFFYLAIPVGSALGYAIGGVLGSAFGWREAFWVMGFPGLLLGVRCWVSGGAAGGTGRGEVLGSRGISLVRNRLFLMNTLAMTAVTFALGGLSVWMPTFLMEKSAEAGAGVGLERVNLVFGAMMVFGGIGATVMGGWAADRVRRVRANGLYAVAGWATVLAGPAVGLAVWASWGWQWVALALAVFLVFVHSGPANAALAESVPEAERPTAFAWNIFIIHALGDAISPALIGGVADRWGLQTGMGVVGCAVLAGGVIWLAAGRRGAVSR
jgi:MFS family permease